MKCLGASVGSDIFIEKEVVGFRLLSLRPRAANGHRLLRQSHHASQFKSVASRQSDQLSETKTVSSRQSLHVTRSRWSVRGRCSLKKEPYVFASSVCVRARRIVTVCSDSRIMPVSSSQSDQDCQIQTVRSRQSDQDSQIKSSSYTSTLRDI